MVRKQVLTTYEVFTASEALQLGKIVLAHVSFFDHSFSVVAAVVVVVVVVVVLNFSHFLLYLQNHWANSTRLSTKYPWVKGIQVCSTERLQPFPRGDNNKRAKIY